jgi:hypothetical protein
VKTAVLLLFIASASLTAQDSDKIFDSIHFKGLKTLSKLEIAKKAQMKSQNGKIAVNMKRLHTILKSETVIKQYKIIDKDNILTIMITEYSPEYIIFITGRNRNIFCEVDKNFKIISAGRLHTTTEPLFILHITAVENESIKKEYQDLMLKALDKVSNSRVKNQVKQLDISHAGSLKVTLKGRRTVFILPDNTFEFEKLEAAVAYLDATGRYPLTLDLRGRMAVVR